VRKGLKEDVSYDNMRVRGLMRGEYELEEKSKLVVDFKLNI